MQYAQDVDESIIRVLFHDKSLGYGELKRSVEKDLQDRKLRKAGYKIPKETYRDHMKKLVDESTINRKEGNDRRGTVFYSLTGQARNKQYLGIFSGRNKKHLIKLYRDLLFYEHRLKETILPEDEVESFLARFRKNRQMIGSGQIVVKNTDETVTSYNVAPEVEFYRVELQELPSHVYLYKIRAFSEGSFLNRSNLGSFDNEEFKSKDIGEAFTALKKLELIKKVLDLDGEPRYVVADETLRDLVKDIWQIWNTKWPRLLNRWQWTERPSKEHREWVTKLYGQENARKIFDDLALERRRHKDVIQNMKRRSRRFKQPKQKTRQVDTALGQRYDEMMKKYGELANILDILPPLRNTHRRI